ncbi:MAG: hypothetical protein HS116_15625 [Planctomycetes bacterium]|nr:hypothetical protein [Planctomycetota bacterium]
MPARSRASDILRYSFLHVFANDKTIDANELAMLERLALEDQKIDEKERIILRNLFSRVTQTQVAPKVWDEIQLFRAKHGI